jgi:hypothetical protein
MRVRTDIDEIYEVYEVRINPCGKQSPDDPDKYYDMRCFLYMRYGNDSQDVIEGVFDCSDATTFEECRSKASKLLDELYKKGCIDISTEEKCEKYGFTFTEVW